MDVIYICMYRTSNLALIHYIRVNPYIEIVFILDQYYDET